MSDEKTETDTNTFVVEFYKMWQTIKNMINLYMLTLFADIPEIRFKLESDTAILPKKGTPYAAAYDLFSDQKLVLKPFSFSKIETNVSVDMKKSQMIYGRIAGRSGLALKQGILIGGGVIDSDYSGTIGIIAFNMSENEVEFDKGQRVAQLIFERKAHAIILNDSYICNERGSDGFGSTDKAN